MAGIFEAWHYCNASWLAAPTENFAEGEDDRAYAEALDDARECAEVDAAERIGQGRTITATLLRAGHRMMTPWPADRGCFTVPNLPMFKEDSDRLFDISASDIVTVNESATAELKRKRAAEEARRAAAAQARYERGQGTCADSPAVPGYVPDAIRN